jgi:hypothetical protein
VLNANRTSARRWTISSTTTARPTDKAAYGGGTRKIVAMWVIVATDTMPPCGSSTATNSSMIERPVRIANAGSHVESSVFQPGLGRKRLAAAAADKTTTRRRGVRATRRRNQAAIASATSAPGAH